MILKHQDVHEEIASEMKGGTPFLQKGQLEAFCIEVTVANRTYIQIYPEWKKQSFLLHRKIGQYVKYRKPFSVESDSNSLESVIRNSLLATSKYLQCILLNLAVHCKKKKQTARLACIEL